MKKFFIFVIAIIMLVARPAAAQEEKSLLDIIEDDERLQTLVAAIQTTELIDTFLGEGPFTVFAPTNDAFNTLPEGTLQTLLLEPDTLAQILTYHLVSDPIMAADLVILNGQEIPTLQGERLTITGNGDNVMINDANVIISDIQASNGVIHLIDKILIPPTVAAAMAGEEPPAEEPPTEVPPAEEPPAEEVPPAESEPTPELVPTPVPAPSTIPDTGADKRQPLPILPALMIGSGLLLLAMGYMLYQRTALE